MAGDATDELEGRWKGWGERLGGMPPKRRKAAPKQQSKKKVAAPAGVKAIAKASPPRTEFAPQTAAELERDGPRPYTPAEIFTVHNLEAYRIHREQLIPLHSGLGESCAELLRSAKGRQRLVVNAGKPSATNPNAGECFHADFGFTPKDAEVYELEWHEPRPLTATLGPSVYCSAADALARYAGGKALADSAELFMILFLNGGESKLAPAPLGGEEASFGYRKQRARILNNLQKMFLVCPMHVRATVDASGWPNAPGSAEPLVTPMMLGCFASIVADKREGAPARDASICGYHDQCRLHILPRAHVRKIRQLIAYFKLESRLPSVWNSLEDGQVNLAAHRQRELDRIRKQHPGLVVQSEEWKERHATMLLGKPWVQRCNLSFPAGEVHKYEDGSGAPPRPVLVPLVRGGVEERNGVPWLYLDEEDDSAHAWAVRDALVRIAGRTPKRRASPKEDAATIDLLTRELANADARLAAWENGFERVVRAFPGAIDHV